MYSECNGAFLLIDMNEVRAQDFDLFQWRSRDSPERQQCAELAET